MTWVLISIKLSILRVLSYSVNLWALSCRLYYVYLYSLTWYVDSYYCSIFLYAYCFRCLLPCYLFSPWAGINHTSLVLTPFYVYLSNIINCITGNQRIMIKRLDPAGTKARKRCEQLIDRSYLRFWYFTLSLILFFISSRLEFYFIVVYFSLDGVVWLQGCLIFIRVLFRAYYCLLYLRLLIWACAMLSSGFSALITVHNSARLGQNLWVVTRRGCQGLQVSEGPDAIVQAIHG